jgi:hypothetical protein
VISRLLTYRGHLRKGSPTSPFIFNLLCGQLDGMIYGMAARFPGMIYTRYGDDLSFSSPTEIFPEEAEKAIRTVLSRLHILLNERKTKRFSHGLLEFPGIVIINGAVRPQGKYITMASQRFCEMTSDERKGHKGFISQFNSVPKVLKKFLVL